ncbi:unnamed protein product [Cyclocybe aegerita]|uniref:Uncharacterized protein n=1 Tax=Cyclocybe aegerita TaxID=1973307 RepID=A0A8S0WFJ6_CYCAE|nr:unnamed protein product [Cyclocybe aegerita]
MSSKIPPVVLPYDLEKVILELTARTYPEQAPKLSRVCRYVQEWIEAIIYETVVLDYPPLRTELFMRTLRQRPAIFFERNVKHLHLTSFVDLRDAREIATVCTGTKTLVIWGDASREADVLMKNNFPPHLERLSLKMTLVRAFPPAAGMFSSLSHLEIVNSMTVDCDALCSELPALTHLAIGEIYWWIHRSMLPSFERLLADCRKLEVLVFISSDDMALQGLRKAGITQDARVVIVPSHHWPMRPREYWTSVQRGGPDFWDMADELVVERKKQLLSTEQ